MDGGGHHRPGAPADGAPMMPGARELVAEVSTAGVPCALVTAAHRDSMEAVLETIGALPGVVVGEALDKELKVKNIEADFFFEAYLNGLAIILHLEFQRNRDPGMDRRMWEYNATMDINTGKPVYSIVVYLVQEENLVGSPYVREIPGTGAGHHFTFQVINLWEIAPEVLKQTEFEALLPLLPLTQAGKSRETVEEMITQLQARNCPDLLTLGYNFAGLVFTDEVDQQWLKERFHKMQDILEGSWVYQEMTAKSLKKAASRALRKVVKKAVRRVVNRVVNRAFRQRSK